MAKQQQIRRTLDGVVSNKIDVAGVEPPRLVRANSAFSKRVSDGSRVSEA